MSIPTNALTPPLLHNGALFIDNSTAESIVRCNQEAEYRIIHQRQYDGGVSALNFGGAIHQGLDVRYRRWREFATESITDQLNAVSNALTTSPVEPGDWRTPSLAHDVIVGYASTFPVDDFSVLERPDPADPTTRLPCVELPFAVPLGSVELPEEATFTNLVSNADGTTRVELFTTRVVPIVWTGKIDAVIEKEGRLWVLDHKTTSVFGPTYFSQYEMSPQMLGYAWALQELLGRQVAGVLINVLAIRKPTKTGKGVEYGRQYISYEPHMIEEWRVNQLTLLSEFFGNILNDYFPKRMTWCITKFQRKCEYFEVCTLPAAHRTHLLYSNVFKHITWSPLTASDTAAPQLNSDTTESNAPTIH